MTTEATGEPPRETKRYGQPHDFMNYNKVCRCCGLRKIDCDLLRPNDLLRYHCRVAAEPKGGVS